jgi:hypothetical protein
MGQRTSSFSHRSASFYTPSGVYSRARKALHQPPICAANEKVVLKLLDIFRALPDLFWDCMKLGNVEPKNMNTFFFGVPERQFNTYSQQFYVNTFMTKLSRKASRTDCQCRDRSAERSGRSSWRLQNLSCCTS